MIPRPLSPLRLGFSSFSLLVMTLACDNAPRKEESPLKPRWSDAAGATATGPVFEDEDFILSVKQPKACEKEGPMRPAPGRRRISVPIEIQGKTARQTPVSALLFTLEDTEGHEFRPTLAGCAPSIAQTTVTRGAEVTGEVAFDVPVESGTLELRYEPFLIGREKLAARVKVPATAQ